MCIISAMRYGYARVSTDGQSVAAQVEELAQAGAEKVFKEVASAAKTDRAQLHRLLNALDEGDVLLVTRLDRLARSTRDLLKDRQLVGTARISGHGFGTLLVHAASRYCGTSRRGRKLVPMPPGSVFQM